MNTTLIAGPGVKRCDALAERLRSQRRVIVQDDLHLLYADRLREKQVREVVYVPSPERWHGIRSEAHAFKALLDACEAAEVAKVVLLSCHRVYGPSSQHNLFLSESTAYWEKPNDREVEALIALDAIATSRALRGGGTSVVVLRPVYVLGSDFGGLLERYVEGSYVPAVFGFDPMVQVIDASDLFSALELALEVAPAGVYNVTGAGTVPPSVLAKERGRERTRLPLALARGSAAALHRLGRCGIEASTLPFLMYVLSTDGSAFEKATGFRARASLPDSLRGTSPELRPGAATGSALKEELRASTDNA